MPGAGRDRKQHRLRPGERGAAEVHVVERVGQQHRGRTPGLALGHDRLGDHEQGFLGADARQHVPLGVERARRQMVAPGQPGGGGGAKLRRPGDRRIAAPEVVVGVQRLAQQSGHRMHRLADRQIDRRALRRRLDPLQQQSEPSEHIVAEFVQPRIEHGPGHSAGRRGAAATIGEYVNILRQAISTNAKCPDEDPLRRPRLLGATTSGKRCDHAPGDAGAGCGTVGP